MISRLLISRHNAEHTCITINNVHNRVNSMYGIPLLVIYVVCLRIKLITRCTINDILLALVAGSLRKYLQQRGVANPPDLHAVIPVDLR